MSRILVLGCGELAWGYPSTSKIFGPQWTRSRLSEKIGLGSDGPLPGEATGQDWVTLAEELDRQTAWRPAGALGPALRLNVQKEEPVNAPLLPAWRDLALSQARWATQRVGGAGVLVTPQDWLESLAGRELLTAWEAEGWSWAALEEVLQKRYSAAIRCISGDGLWLRVMQSESGWVFANGPEAARATELAPAILNSVLGQLDDELAERWRSEEEPTSGWYVHQQLAHRIARALKDGRTTVDLTGGTPFQISKEGRMIADPASPSGVLFRFSSAAAQKLYRPLSALRITVDLPTAALSWWEQVSAAGFLCDSAGVAHPGFRWEDRKTVLFEGAESRQLASFLGVRGLEREEVDPARLEDALGLGAPLPPLTEEAGRDAPAPPAKAPVAPILPVAPVEPAAPAARIAVMESAPVQTVAPRPVETSVAPSRVEVAAADPLTAERVAPQASTPLAQPALPEEDFSLREEGVPRREEALGDDGQREETLETAPVEEVEEEEKLSAFFTFVPQKFNLDVPHRPDRVRVSLDGEKIEAGNVRRSTLPGAYTIEGIPVSHGAIVRIDFEPPQD
jgi:hypothetical protein